MQAAMVRAKFLERVQRTPTVTSFRFVPETPLSFVPGQFVTVMFDPVNPRNRELNKYLSFSAAPLRPYLEFTKRMSQSEFSRRLSALQAGDRVTLQGPSGTCVIDEQWQSVGFLVGGIGITPVIAIIEEMVYRNQRHTDVQLLYANRSSEEIAFRAELEQWSAALPRLRVTYLTECEPQDTICVQGQIDQNMLQQHLCLPHNRTLFVFGPPAMVRAVKAACVQAGCNSDLIHGEAFAGY